MITICYITNRRNPRIHWFLPSLGRQLGDERVKLVIVDFYKEERDAQFRPQDPRFNTVHVAPMPNVWQGRYRLTTRNYFAASNARNTGLCYADDGYIVYVDDLSVLLPGWFAQVQQAAREGWVACGAYAKVPKLEVEDGFVKSFAGHPITHSTEEVANMANNYHPVGFDNRWKHTPFDSMDPFSCAGNWLYGASCAMPVEALLQINGWDEDCDGMGSEDYICGLMLQQHGYALKYCKRMMTLESEEAHGEEPPFHRVIKGPANGPLEHTNASHRILNMVNGGGRKSAPNYFGEGGIRELRKRILAGGEFPNKQIPQHHWYDSMPLSSM